MFCQAPVLSHSPRSINPRKSSLIAFEVVDNATLRGIQLRLSSPWPAATGEARGTIKPGMLLYACQGYLHDYPAKHFLLSVNWF